VTEHPNARLVEAAVLSFKRGDLAAFGEAFAPNVRWHVPGEGPLAGTYSGLQAVLSLFARAFGLSAGRYDVEPLDIMDSERHAVLWQRVRAERDGRRLDVTEALVFRIEDGRVVDVWERTDQYAFDDFFSVGETLRRRTAAGPAHPSGSDPAAAFEVSSGATLAPGRSRAWRI